MHHPLRNRPVRKRPALDVNSLGESSLDFFLLRAREGLIVRFGCLPPQSRRADAQRNQSHADGKSRGGMNHSSLHSLRVLGSSMPESSIFAISKPPYHGLVLWRSCRKNREGSDFVHASPI